MINQEFKFKFGNTKYTFGKGGLHSIDKPRLIRPTNNEILRDADISSQYPNAIKKRRLYPRHLSKQWLEGYTDIINRRIEAKKTYKKTGESKFKSLDEAFKLALNGGSNFKN